MTSSKPSDSSDALEKEDESLDQEVLRDKIKKQMNVVNIKISALEEKKKSIISFLEKNPDLSESRLASKQKEIESIDLELSTLEKRKEYLSSLLERKIPIKPSVESEHKSSHLRGSFIGSKRRRRYSKQDGPAEETKEAVSKKPEEGSNSKTHENSDKKAQEDKNKETPKVLFNENEERLRIREYAALLVAKEKVVNSFLERSLRKVLSQNITSEDLDRVISHLLSTKRMKILRFLNNNLDEDLRLLAREREITARFAELLASEERGISLEQLKSYELRVIDELRNSNFPQSLAYKMRTRKMMFAKTLFGVGLYYLGSALLSGTLIGTAFTGIGMTTIVASRMLISYSAFQYLHHKFAKRRTFLRKEPRFNFPLSVEIIYNRKDFAWRDLRDAVLSGVVDQSAARSLARAQVEVARRMRKAKLGAAAFSVAGGFFGLGWVVDHTVPLVFKGVDKLISLTGSGISWLYHLLPDEVERFINVFVGETLKYKNNALHEMAVLIKDGIEGISKIYSGLASILSDAYTKISSPWIKKPIPNTTLRVLFISTLAASPFLVTDIAKNSYSVLRNIKMKISSKVSPIKLSVAEGEGSIPLTDLVYKGVMMFEAKKKYEKLFQKEASKYSIKKDYLLLTISSLIAERKREVENLPRRVEEGSSIYLREAEIRWALEEFKNRSLKEVVEKSNLIKESARTTREKISKEVKKEQNKH